MKNCITYGEPIMNWTLIRALKDRGTMKAGEWGLVYTPTYVMFSGNLESDPAFIFKNLPPQYNIEADTISYLEKIDIFERDLTCDPGTGSAFYISCLKHGFDEDESLALWVADHILKTIIYMQPKLQRTELECLLEIMLEKEEYEKAALIRDTLDNRSVNAQKIF